MCNTLRDVLHVLQVRAHAPKREEDPLRCTHISPALPSCARHPWTRCRTRWQICETGNIIQTYVIICKYMLPGEYIYVVQTLYELTSVFYGIQLVQRIGMDVFHVIVANDCSGAFLSITQGIPCS